MGTKVQHLDSPQCLQKRPKLFFHCVATVIGSDGNFLWPLSSGVATLDCDAPRRGQVLSRSGDNGVGSRSHSATQARAAHV